MTVEIRAKGVNHVRKKQSDKGKTICVLIGDVSYDYTRELMRGINDAAAHNGAQLFYLTGKQRNISPSDISNEQNTVSHYNSIYDYSSLIGADAYIISCGSLSGIGSDEEYRQFLKRFDESAYVLLQKEIDTGIPGRCSITVDNYTSFCKCIEHLILQHDYKKIAYVSGPKQHPESMEREKAYRDTMRKHGMMFDESMVLYGDLSGFVDKQVTKLLQDHPDLEAIAFCNDEMAKSGYRVCESNNLRVGIDIAITGFDNLTTGQTMTPSLTTISQDAYRTGELALIQALALAAGEPAESVKLDTHLEIRNSCGCYQRDHANMDLANALNPEMYINAMVGYMQEDFTGIFSRMGQKHMVATVDTLMAHIKALAITNPLQPLDSRALDAWLLTLAAELAASGVIVAERLHSYLLQIAADITQPSLKKFYQIILQIHGFLFLYETREAAKRVETIRSQAWFVPEFVRDLVVLVDDDQSVFINVVNKLRSIGLKSLYICLLPEPQIRRESLQPHDVEKLLLAAYLSDRSANAYPRAQMPVFDKKDTLRNLQDLKSAANLICFSIFSGEMQFGIFLCDGNRDNNPLLQIIGLQLGILVNFLDLKRKERIVKEEFEHIQKRNEILNYLSEYDPMCNVYNRRGFIQQATRMNCENIGKRAYLAFTDLDRLKDINDNFGHSAGDEAIRAASEILKTAMRGGDLIARIGGDEFVGMFIADRGDFQRFFESRIKQAMKKYNLTSDKPYLVTISVGITSFQCALGLEIEKMINEADHYLYKAKKHKPASILKQR